VLKDSSEFFSSSQRTDDGQRVTKDVVKTQESMNAGAQPERPTIFHTLLGSDPSLYDVPLLQFCTGEAFALLTAAADTTGNAMGLAAFNVVTHPDIYSKLRTEMIEAFPDMSKDMRFTDLEQLPYLTGVVKEGLR